MALDTKKYYERIKQDIEEEDVGRAMKKPFDPSNIKVRLQPMTIDLMMARIEHEEINLDTAFQRKAGLWKGEQQSHLIESILIRFPLPVFYFDGSDPDKWLVIDGLQRLTSLKRFIITKELKLEGLEFLNYLDGKTWDDLDRPQQRQIKETYLQCYVIEEGEGEAKFNIFKRINTGGLMLTSQEIRHAMHQDVANYLQTLAESAEFKTATRGKVDPERMLDRDFINRFLAFYVFNCEKDYHYEDDLDSFMNKTLSKIAKENESYRKDIEAKFKAAMMLSAEIFGEAAFCKNDKYKRINKALFEVMSVSFARLSKNQRAKLSENKKAFKKHFYEAIDEGNFYNSLTSNTGGKANIDLRHRVFSEIVAKTLKI